MRGRHHAQNYQVPERKGDLEKQSQRIVAKDLKRRLAEAFCAHPGRGSVEQAVGAAAGETVTEGPSFQLHTLTSKDPARGPLTATPKGHKYTTNKSYKKNKHCIKVIG